MHTYVKIPYLVLVYGVCDQNLVRDEVPFGVEITMQKASWLADFLCVAVLFFYSSNAHAAVCDDLQSRKFRLEQDAVKLVIDHPGVNIAIAGCAMVGQSEYQDTGDKASSMGSFLGCITLACLLAGSDNCVDTAKRWFGFFLQKSAVEKQMESASCIIR